ncbi:TadE/TadG family type IV pilus assembly protein [Candidatus Viridilinea mediisalina]|uniref:Uncharacterized protein n=1 Tax=Candidatus Viridilinea mediisalina TaxID=2024553 RepID=A0A2A6RHP2_9CHLR|nr:hypothetical protein [Candidatus Viridilinea mediisalina]PDW02597.1 hypothetical protein CJ255_13185 [Candidatus Viridilinea mediisalina]
MIDHTKPNAPPPKQRGQSLPLAALMMPVLVAFVLMAIEVSERWLQVAMIQDALQHATRSAVQQLDYSAFARNEMGLRATGDCINVTTVGAAGGPCAAVIAVADQILRTNLRGVRGISGATPNAAIDAAAATVRWSVFPNGGTCSVGGRTVSSPAPDIPLICAEMRPVMTGIVGWGDFTPLIIAADVLDPAR